MCKIIQIFFLILLNTSLFAQNNFKLDIDLPQDICDSIFIASPYQGSLNDAQDFKIENTDKIKFNNTLKIAVLKIGNNNTVVGSVLSPQPLILSYYIPQAGSYISHPFFVAQGENIRISVKNKNLDYDIVSSPINSEYNKLHAYLEPYTKKLVPYAENNSKDVERMQAALENYIKKNPTSYVAFWEVFDNYAKYGFSKTSLKSISFFSSNIKKSYSYKRFYKIMSIENSTNIGGDFPEMQFKDLNKISKSVFKDYKVTLIDYWSTTCKPCIKDLPRLVQLYQKYKQQKVNFISVADENTPERIKLANKILKEKNVMWSNYFDVNKEFPKKMSATGYPFQILVDGDGKIIDKKYGEIELIESAIDNYINKH